MENHNLILAFLLTLFAGLATGIGSLIAFFTKKLNYKFLSLSLGFSAGVMIYVSFVEILAKAKSNLITAYGSKTGNILAVVLFFLGIVLIAIIDFLIPSYENPHEAKEFDDENNLSNNINNKELIRMGLFSALAIAIHNFPEGFATFMGSLYEPNIGLSIALAVAIHNIPEGIAISIPIYYATLNRKKAFYLSFLSGLSEPLGALIGYFLLINFLDKSALGFSFAIVSGIMVYISLDELLPQAEKCGNHHYAISGLMVGMLVMALSLILFQLQ